MGTKEWQGNFGNLKKRAMTSLSTDSAQREISRGGEKKALLTASTKPGPPIKTMNDAVCLRGGRRRRLKLPKGIRLPVPHPLSRIKRAVFVDSARARGGHGTQREKREKRDIWTAIAPRCNVGLSKSDEKTTTTKRCRRKGEGMVPTGSRGTLLPIEKGGFLGPWGKVLE